MANLTTSASLLRSAFDLAWTDAVASANQAQRAVDHAPRGSLLAGWGFWLLALADLHQKRAQEARACLAAALGLFVQQEDMRGQAMCAELDAAIALSNGDPLRAAMLHRAIDAVPDPGLSHLDRFYRAMQRAQMARRQGQHDKALGYLEAATQAAQSSGNLGAQALAQSQRAYMLTELERLEEAEAIAEASLGLARHANARSAVATAASALLLLHHLHGRASGVAEMARVLSDLPQADLGGCWSSVHLPLALASFSQGDFKRSEAWLNPGPGFSLAEGDSAVFWAWLNGRILLQKGAHGEARDLVERTLLTHGRSATLLHQRELLHVASEAQALLGRHDLARSFRDRAEALVAAGVDSAAQATDKPLPASTTPHAPTAPAPSVPELAEKAALSH
jgi:tetratricopeptide (TPR) repeat protein